MGSPEPEGTTLFLQIGTFAQNLFFKILRELVDRHPPDNIPFLPEWPVLGLMHTLSRRC